MTRRDERLDLMRGYFMAVITVNHLYLAGNDWMRAVTGLNQLWVSAAAGFVIVSGAVVGTIYPGRLARDGIGPCARWALRRSLQLYLITVVGQIVLAAVDLFLHHRYGLATTVPDSIPCLLRGALFQDGYRFHYLSLLPLYAVLLPLAVVVVLGLQRGYLGWILLGSFLLWYMRLSDPRALRVFATGFQPASWQTIYVVGILAGFYREPIARWCRGHPAARRALTVPLFMAAGAVLYISYQVAFNGWFSGNDLLRNTSVIFSRKTVGAGMVGAALVVMPVLYIMAGWQPFRTGLGWLLLPLGRHALVAYVVQAVLGFAVVRLPWWPFAWWPAPAKAAFGLAAVLLVWALTRLFVTTYPRLRERFRPRSLPLHNGRQKSRRP